ncbi:cytochrome c oxidase subunit II [Corynebacterium glutamicum MB001]|uniref:Cytochrome c oxidase subunit 2 n=2 Tax=Corynebacterium glutamicum (strain ATCC 13032 / DSM 20300 / JCM 1318 / BCRC 11384 / CCUG 27702 / LMG 3730 / NBRC 12168 / NCIMB 10025 / NRRL B-2784 / 534) TaxID=196627 RepID=COX2_CORGL|nr:cytochrome c oxidase subunit II [Corynebacterium glutamicum]Q8NNK2.1 RecName: Full=Cytochrome c oxidase subunit 2; AltName: Full=Cytochrome aa3 subunit 2; AltName: Full=Cytochrome c oxidase polypeptide II; AltName: Full=Oxidase aa(3) subunit 2; Flags: Precursor [Corynebacterium glutamicum ATCC 13032]7Q21_G Chain G, Cytochrome c oxidase subunit 2 [Corynebacterium glutamicum ATCC 13032]7Q21_g Chain g, Cytochrome c oxidase subunit 2 [Corynebacterium glutamicum ATCC 13032]AGT05932.1 cytochrome c
MEQQNKRGLKRKALLGGVLGLGGLAMAGCEVAPPGGVLGDFLRMGWPDGITPEAVAMGNFWSWVWVAAWIIGIIMWGLFLTAIFAWGAKRAEKRGEGEFPKQLQYNVPLELVLTIVPIIIVMVLFFFTVQTQDKVTALDKNPEVTVDVTAYQWNWKFGYSEIDGSLAPGGQDYQGSDPERQAAAEASKKDPSGDNPIHGNSKSDVSYLEFNRIETLGTTDEIPVMVLPVNTPIEFNLASADVAHSFWVPEFLFKRDAYAHPEANKSQRVFQIEEITEEGAFVGRCAEMCGTYHAMMNFELRVVDRDSFAEYISFRDSNPDATNAQALEHIGQAPYATSTSPFVSDRTATRDGENTQSNA